MYTIESLLYTFNVQCKFMMPCKYPQPDLLILDHFSYFRGSSEGTVDATNQIRDLPHKDIDK